MSIHMDNVFPVLACAISGFEASDEDRKEDAPYFFLSDMRRFVCEKAGSGSVIEVDQFAALLDQLAIDGDREIQDMLLDLLEGLQECDLKFIVASRFGSRVQRLWTQLCEKSDQKR